MKDANYPVKKYNYTIYLPPPLQLPAFPQQHRQRGRRPGCRSAARCVRSGEGPRRPHLLLLLPGGPAVPDPRRERSAAGFGSPCRSDSRGCTHAAARGTPRRSGRKNQKPSPRSGAARRGGAPGQRGAWAGPRGPNFSGAGRGGRAAAGGRAALRGGGAAPLARCSAAALRPRVPPAPLAAGAAAEGGRRGWRGCAARCRRP